MTEAMIGDFLKPADKRRHAVDLLVDDINFDAQQVKNRERRDLTIREKKMKMAASRASRDADIRAENEERGSEESPLQSVQGEIDIIVENFDDEKLIGK